MAETREDRLKLLQDAFSRRENASSGSYAAYDEEAAARIEALRAVYNQQFLPQQANKWARDASDFAKKISADAQARSKGYQSPDSLKAYQDSISPQLSDLIGRAKYAQQYAGLNNDAEYGKGVNDTLSYLNSIGKSLQNEQAYWAQWANEDAYKKSGNYYNDTYGEDAKNYDGGRLFNTGSLATPGQSMLDGNDVYKSLMGRGKDSFFDQLIYNSNTAGGDVYRNKADAVLQMSDDERRMYSYLLDKKGKAEADEYYNSISAELANRAGKHASDMLMGLAGDSQFLKDVLSGLYSVPAGVQNAYEGLGNAIASLGGKTLDPSVTQATHGYNREQTSAVGGVISDLGFTTGNMLPAWAAGALTGTPYTGDIILGLTSAGNSYADAKREGYDQGQAMVYGLVNGTLEAGMQYLLGGISNLGGKAASKISKHATSYLNKLSNAGVRAVLQTGSKLLTSMGSEATEEYLQSVLDPLVRNIILGEDNDFWAGFTSEDALYSALLGALSAGLLEGPGIITSAAEANKIGKRAFENGSWEGAVDYAMQLDPVSEPYKLAKALRDGTIKADGNNVGNLYTTLSEYMAESKKLVRKGKMTTDQYTSTAAAIDTIYQARLAAQQQSTPAAAETATGTDIPSVLNNDIYQEVKAVETDGKAAVREANIIARIADGDKSVTGSQIDSVVNTNAKTREIVSSRLGVDLGNTNAEARRAVKQYMDTVSSTKTAANTNTQTAQTETANTAPKTEEETRVQAVRQEADAITKTMGTEGQAVYKQFTANMKLGDSLVYATEAMFRFYNQGVNAENSKHPSKKFRDIPGYEGISAEMKQAAYNAGRVDVQAKSGSIAEIVTKTKETAEKAAQQQAEIKKNAKASKVNIKELAPSAGKWSVDPKIDMDTLTSKQTAAVSYLKAVSEVSGMNITLMSGVDVTGAFSVENGHYDGVTNTLYVSVNAGMQSITDITGSAILKTASHEITHYIAASGTQTYSLLEDYVLSRFTEQFGEKSVDNRIEDIQEQYKDQVGKELTREQAKEEMVAAACEMMLKNSEVFEKLARQNLTLAQRIKAGLDGFIKKLSANRKAAFENLDATSPEARAIAASEASLKETQKLWDNALKGAIKENEGRRAGKDTMLELRDEGRYNAEYEKPLTSEDVETLHSIGRKSIKDFTSEDIAKTQKWAYKFYRELGTKSPFFRASFGEWRAYDTSKVKRISVSNINLDEALAAMQRGTVKNTDSNWNINVGSLGAKDTISHSGREKISAKMLSEIDQIIENAVLLDTETSQRSSNNKHNDTAWMHKLYAFVDYNDTPYIAKITVEEYGVNESARRFYNLRGIKIEPIGGAPDVKTSYGTMPVIDSTTSIANSPNGILSVSEGLTDGKSATANNTVAALYNFVKRFDKDFSAGAAVNPILLNKDGTPKVFYHGAKKNGGFTEFRPWQYFTAQKNYAQRYAERGNDNSLYAVYLRADKAFDTRDAEAKQIFENIRQEYGLGELQDTGLPDWTDGYDISDYLDEHPELGYDAIILDEGGDLVDGKPVSRGESIVIKDSSQIKSATDNIGTFDRNNPDIRYELRDKRDTEYAKLAKDPEKNEKRLSQLVEQAAKAAGYDSPLLYHGTQSFGFTAFDLAKTDDGRSIFLTSNPDIASTYSGISGSRRISEASDIDVNGMSVREVAQMLNRFPPESGIDYAYSYVPGKAEIAEKVDSGIKELRKLTESLRERFANDSSEMYKLNHLRNVLDIGKTDTLSATLWTILNKTDIFNGHTDFVNNLEQNIRLLKKAPESGGFVVEKSLDGYSIEVFTESAARKELSANLRRGNYALYAKLGNSLTVEGDGENWNALDFRAPDSKYEIQENDGRYKIINKSTRSAEWANGKMSWNSKEEAQRIIDGFSDKNDWAKRLSNTRQIAEYAKEQGYDSVLFRNIRDNGGQNASTDFDTTADVYVIFNPNNVKSADTVTRDGNGNVIPLSQRFNAGENDIRFELRSDENQFNPRKELSNLFMQIAQNEQEKKSLRSYQAAIHELNNTEIEISKLQQEMQGTDKLKSPQKYYELQNKLRQAEAKLNRYDGRLVQLEATKPMKDLIARREQRLKEQFARSSTTRAKYRNNIKKNIRSLDKKLRTNSGQKHVLLELQPVVAQLLNVFTENTSVFKKEQLARLREIYAKFSPAADSKISSDEKEVTRWKSTAEYSSAYSEMIYDLIEEVRPLVQGKRLIDLDTELLAAVNDIVGNINKMVNQADEMFIAGRAESLREISENTLRDMENSGYGQKRNPRAETNKTVQNAKAFFSYKNAMPVYVFERLGDTAVEKLWDPLQAAAGKKAREEVADREYWQGLRRKYNHKSWDNNGRLVQLESGRKIYLTPQEAMSIYALDKREATHRTVGGKNIKHLQGGGISFPEAAKITVKEANGKTRTEYRLATSGGMRLTEGDIKTIGGLLTQEQRAYADDVVKYLSTTIADRGNAVSRELYGINIFNESYYFPITVDKTFLQQSITGQADKLIKNAGMTKSLTQDASKPVYVMDFDRIVAQHLLQMEGYDTLSVPLDNFQRWLRYQSFETDAKGKRTYNDKTVSQTLKDVYGKEMQEYISNFLTDVNAASSRATNDGLLDKAIGVFKKNAVLASLSVAIQQPSAIGRALLYIDPKYFVGEGALTSWSKANLEEMMKYSDAAFIKENGAFDPAVSRGALEKMLYEEPETVKEKIKALISRDSTYRDNIAGWLPRVMDSITWRTLWMAIKNETADAHPELSRTSEEFLQIAGKRMDYVVNRTQVYDSMLSKSELMRSKSALMKMTTAFMNEPTTAYNMLYHAAEKLAVAKGTAKKAAGKHLARAVAAFVTATAFNALLKSLVTAARKDNPDDEDDKTYLEWYAGEVVGNFFDDLNPIKLLPVLRDVFSLLEGYDVERSDMESISKLIDAGKAIVDGNASLDKKLEKLLIAVGVATGIPLENLIRDTKGLRNVIMDIADGWQTTAEGVGNAAKSGLPFAQEDEGSINDKLFRAYMNQDETAIKRYEQAATERFNKKKSAGGYKSYDSAEYYIRKEMRSRLAHSDEIKAVYDAAAAGDLQAYKAAVKALTDRGFKEIDVIDAKRTYANNLKKAAETPVQDTTATEQPEEETAVFDREMFTAALENNDGTDRQIIEQQLEGLAPRSEEYKDKAAKLKSRITAYLKPKYQDAFLANDTATMLRISRQLQTYRQYGIVYNAEILTQWRKAARTDRK